MNKPVVGQKLLQVVHARRDEDSTLNDVVVVKVGRKYFTTGRVGEEDKDWCQDIYHLDGWNEKTDFTALTSVYESRQAWEDDKEYARLNLQVRRFFDRWARLTLGQLRAIAAITEEAK